MFVINRISWHSGMFKKIKSTETRIIKKRLIYGIKIVIISFDNYKFYNYIH